MSRAFSCSSSLKPLGGMTNESRPFVAAVAEDALEPVISSRAVSVAPESRMVARSMVFCSSRTLPCHGLRSSASAASLAMGGVFLPISRQNFRNTTNAYTGAHVDWRSRGGSRLQLLWAMPQIRLPEDAEGIRDNRVEWDQETTDLQLMGAHLTLPRALGGTAEIYGFALKERDAPDRRTTAFRLVNEEGDGLPGLAVDARFAPLAPEPRFAALLHTIGLR